MFIELGPVKDDPKSDKVWHWYTMDKHFRRNKPDAQAVEFDEMIDELHFFCWDNFSPQYDPWAGGLREETWKYIPIGNGFAFRNEKDAVKFVTWAKLRYE